MISTGVTRRRMISGAAMLAAGLLSACTETASDFNANAEPRVKVPGVPVALVSLQGAPETFTSRLSSAISQQAARREIVIVGIDGNPRYQVRGYVSAQTGATGASELAWVFDVFDAQRKRAQRISGVEPLRSGGDIWNSLSDQDIQKIAFKSVDDIAAFLAGTPEAVAARNAPSLPSTNTRNPASTRAVGLMLGN
ncbi:MAG: hypothetical protein ACRCWF_15900 [Beijerinckiaceae bacterium]